MKAFYRLRKMPSHPISNINIRKSIMEKYTILRHTQIIIKGSFQWRGKRLLNQSVHGAAGSPCLSCLCSSPFGNSPSHWPWWPWAWVCSLSGKTGFPPTRSNALSRGWNPDSSFSAWGRNSPGKLLKENEMVSSP